MLVQLLEYDPMALQPNEPGFGSGSGKPPIMFGFLKHLWNTAAGQRAAEQQQQALYRCMRRLLLRVCHLTVHIAREHNATMRGRMLGFDVKHNILRALHSPS